MIITEFSKFIDCKVAFTTKDDGEHYEGIVKLILVESSLVTFEHVFLLPSREYLGTMHILFNEINSIKLLESAEKILNVKKDNSVEISEIRKIPDGENFFDFLPENLRHGIPSDFYLLDSKSESFDKAIDHLSSCNCIGVSFHGAKVSRFGTLSWICMASSDIIFLFDIERLGADVFAEGLQSILQNEKIEKVIHDCRTIADCLLHKYYTRLKNVFDTQVADYHVNMQKCESKEVFSYVSSLDSCLVKYLKVPQQFLYNRNKCTSLEDEIAFFQKRPISREFTNFLLKSVMYLTALKKVQKKMLIHPFEKAVELSLNVMQDVDDSEAYLAQQSTESATKAPDYLLNALKRVRFESSDLLFTNKMPFEKDAT